MERGKEVFPEEVVVELDRKMKVSRHTREEGSRKGREV